MGSLIERVASILSASVGKKEPLAFLFPRLFARKIAEELYGARDNEKQRLLRLIDQGGFVGKMFEIPVLVLEDTVVCVMDEEDIQHLPLRIRDKISNSLLNQYDPKSTSYISG